MAEQGTASREVEPATGLRRGADIAERLLLLAATIVRLARKLPRDVGGRHVASQLVRSGTSAGANYEEGRAAESRADFIHKLRVAAKEMRETIFWLSLVQRSAFLPSSASEPLEALIREANELVAILMASARTARSSRRER
jgi:four helix bundle protein